MNYYLLVKNTFIRTENSESWSWCKMGGLNRIINGLLMKLLGMSNALYLKVTSLSAQMEIKSKI